MKTCRVLVVEDSSFFRKRIVEIIEKDQRLQVVGTAENGKEAIDRTLELDPDVITMDVEMPVMDGITAVRRIMKLKPTPVLMLSSLTREGARATLDALDAGAVDFLPKRFDEIARDREQAGAVLRGRLLEITQGNGARLNRPMPRQKHASAETASSSPSVAPRRYDIVAIGCSTGGPLALQQILGVLPAGFPAPVLLVQHMPGAFTTTFAARLNELSQLNVKEAEDGDIAQPGCAYLAPGGKQMLVERQGAHTVLRVVSGEPGQIYKPSVDLTFSSIAESGLGKTLAIVLTGMGSDGCKGAERLKNLGANVWAQDKATSTIFGMPAAVIQAGLADEILPLYEIGDHLSRAVR